MLCAVSFIVTIAILLLLFRCYVVSLQKAHLAKVELILANLSFSISKVTYQAEGENLSISIACNMIRQIHDAAITRAKLELHSD